MPDVVDIDERNRVASGDSPAIVKAAQQPYAPKADIPKSLTSVSLEDAFGQESNSADINRTRGQIAPKPVEATQGVTAPVQKGAVETAPGATPVQKGESQLPASATLSTESVAARPEVAKPNEGTSLRVPNGSSVNEVPRPGQQQARGLVANSSEPRVIGDATAERNIAPAPDVKTGVQSVEARTNPVISDNRELARDLRSQTQNPQIQQPIFFETTDGRVKVGKTEPPTQTTGEVPVAKVNSVSSSSVPAAGSIGDHPIGSNKIVPTDRIDVSPITPKGNTGSVEAANIARQNVGSAERPNQFIPTSVVAEAPNRTAPGVSPDAGNRDLGGRDGLARTTISGNTLDSQSKQLPGGAEKISLGLDIKQAPGDAASARVSGPQTSSDASAKSGVGNAPNDFGTRREAGVQLPDTKQTSGRTDSGVQLPDTKQSSGRTDTGGTRLPDARNDTGRNDANTGKLPDARTLANLDQKFGDKVNPPGKGGGVPIALPGIPDILGGLRTDKDGKPVKDAKADLPGSKDSPGPKDGAVRSEAPGGRDAKEGKGESQGSKDSKVADGRGDTKSGADDRSIAGQKGTRSEADGTTKSSDGKSVPDVRGTAQDGRSGADGKSADGRSQGGSNLVHDGGTKSDGTRGGRAEGADRGTDKGIGEKGSGEKGVGADKGFGDGKTRVDQPVTRVVDVDGKLIGGRPEAGGAIKADLGDKGHGDVGAAGKPVGSRGDAPFVLPPGSLPVPDLVGGIKNVGQQIDGRTGKPIPADDKGIRQSDKVDGSKGDAGKLDPGKVVGGKTDVGKVDPTKVDGVKPDAKGIMGDGVKTIVTGGVAGGDGVKTAVTGGAKVGEGVKNVGASEVATDGKQVAGKNPVGAKTDGAIIVPPSAVPLTEMIGNLKGIAARIFPPESRAGRPDAFDNSLPGRKTERLEDRIQSTLGSGVRAESTIPIVRVIGERIGKADEQFVIKLPQTATDANKAPQSRPETSSPPPWIPPEYAVSDKSVPGLKGVDVNAAKSTEAKSVTNDVQQTAPKVGDHQVPHVEKPDQIAHDEAAERLLVNLELVGSVESAPASESDEEEVFPLAAIEYFGGEFEKAISNEEDVMFDGDGVVADDDEQSTRYQYIVEAGDTVELIAIKVFKNVTLAPLIYEINKDAIPIGMQDGRMVFTLKVGTVIWLPFPKEIKAYMQT